MRVAVGRISPDRLAQPVDGGLGIAIEPVRVSEVEDVVGIVGIEIGRFGEVVRREPRLRRRAASKLDDAEIIERRRRRLRIGQRLERAVRVVVLLEIQLRQADQKTRAPRVGRVRGHLRDDRQRLLVVPLFVVHVPQREARAVERRLQFQRGVQVVDRRERCLREQPLDEVLERGERRLLANDVSRRHRAGGREAHGNAIDCREEIGQRTALGDVYLHLPRVERDAACVQHQRVVLDLQIADHDLRRADDLADADDRRVRQRRHRRHLQALERLLPFPTRDRVHAARQQIVGEQHGRALAEPENPPFALDVLERHDEDTRRGGRFGADTLVRPCLPCRRQPMGRDGACSALSHRRRLRELGPYVEVDHDSDREDERFHAEGSWPFASATFSTHVASPVPRHATTSVWAPTLNIAISFVNAAA